MSDRPFINVRIPIEDAARVAMEQQTRQMFGDLDAILCQVSNAREHLEAFARTAFVIESTIETPAAELEAPAIGACCSDEAIAEIERKIDDPVRFVGFGDLVVIKACLAELLERRQAARKGGQA